MRHKILLLILSLVLATPLAAEAQQTGKVYQIGVVSAAVAPGHLTVLWRAFLEAMRELNYVEGRNLVVRQAFAAGKRGALPGLVADLVKTMVDVIVTTSTPETLVAKRATSTIPIVMTVVLATGIAFVALLLDRDSAQNHTVLFVAAFASVLSVLRLARSVWVLERVIQLITNDSPSGSNGGAVAGR